MLKIFEVWAGMGIYGIELFSERKIINVTFTWGRQDYLCFVRRKPDDDGGDGDDHHDGGHVGDIGDGDS